MIFLKEEIKKYASLLNVDFDQINFKITHEHIHRFDDKYGYHVEEGKGTIWGVNERSLLLSFYHFLRSNGVVFVRPGQENEIYPKVQTNELNGYLDLTSKYRYKIMCIEGSVQLKHVLDMIDFLPKIGMNGYFIQFDVPYEFFKRWYTEQNKAPEISVSDVENYKKLMVEEIKKRHLIYHAVGHGWTTKVLGIDGSGWHHSDLSTVSQEKQDYIALVNSKRKFFNGIPLNTQLCYSNSEVQKAFVNTVQAYLIEHPEIDVLHVWLADDYNNFCTCETCQCELPAHYYVQILNQIDERLSQSNISTKIAFLAYYELLWPPKLRLSNEDRFILMFAPITRTYLKSISTVNMKDERISEFKLNQSVYPADLNENMRYYRAWKEIFKGDSFIFDYHFMWDGFKEWTHDHLSHTLAKDINHLEIIGLDGFVSCQLTRISYPTALGLHTLGRGLSEGIVNFNDFKKEIYNSYDKTYIQFIDEIKKFIPHAWMRREVGYHDQKTHKMVLEGIAYIEYWIKQEDIENTRNSLALYFMHMFKIVASKIEDNETDTSNAFEKLKAFVNNNREKLESQLDYFYLNHIFKEVLEYKDLA